MSLTLFHVLIGITPANSRSSRTIRRTPRILTVEILISLQVIQILITTRRSSNRTMTLNNNLSHGMIHRRSSQVPLLRADTLLSSLECSTDINSNQLWEDLPPQRLDKTLMSQSTSQLTMVRLSLLSVNLSLSRVV